MPRRFLSGMKNDRFITEWCMEKICIRTKRRFQRLRPFPCRKPGRPSLFY